MYHIPFMQKVKKLCTKICQGISNITLKIFKRKLNYSQLKASVQKVV